MSKLVCWNCGANLDSIPRPISRHANCPLCFNELHCCRFCRHYDPAASMTCFEDRADPPLQKENANFCDFFSPRFSAFENKTVDQSTRARNNLEALFADSAEDTTSPSGDKACLPAEEDEDAASLHDQHMPSKEELARKKLDNLFE